MYIGTAMEFKLNTYQDSPTIPVGLRLSTSRTNVKHLQPNSMHVYLDVNPTEFNEVYSQITVLRVASLRTASENFLQLALGFQAQEVYQKLVNQKTSGKQEATVFPLYPSG